MPATAVSHFLEFLRTPEVFVAVALASLLVFHVGYVLGRRERRRRRQQAFDSMSFPYFEGINQLIKGNRQRALKVFVECCPLREDTVETFLLMAEIFSKQGDLQQAITLHKRILSSEVSATAHKDAQLGLARDYVSSGLFGQARLLLDELVKEDPYLRVPALRLMREICQLESDWAGAVRHSRELCATPQRDSGFQDRQRLAHYLCEQAAILLAEDELLRAQETLREATRMDGGCSRAWHLLCRLELRLGRGMRALTYCMRAAREDPVLAPAYTDDLLQCIPADAGMEVARRRLQKLLAEDRTRDWALVCLSRHAERLLGTDAAMDSLSESIADRPSLRWIERLLELQMGGGTGRESGLGKVRGALREWLRRRKAFQCRNCGYVAEELHWNCPGCRSWGRAAPVEAAKAEALPSP